MACSSPSRRSRDYTGPWVIYQKEANSLFHYWDISDNILPLFSQLRAARSIASCHLPTLQVLPDITYLRVESQWKSTLHHTQKSKYATLKAAEPYFSSGKAADQNVQHELSITKWQSQILKKCLQQARETCSLPAKCKCYKLSWSTQAPGFNLQTLPISINLSPWGLYWIIPHRSPLRIYQLFCW